MRNHELETIGTTFDQDFDLRIAFRVGGFSGPAPQRAGGAFDGTGHAPSSPGNANIADHAKGVDKPRGPKGEGKVIRRSTGTGTDAAKGARPQHKPTPNAPAQAQDGATMMGTKPRGGLRAV